MAFVQVNEKQVKCLYIAENDWDGYGCFVDDNDTNASVIYDEGPLPGGAIHTQFYSDFKKALRSHPAIGRWLWNVQDNASTFSLC